MTTIMVTVNSERVCLNIAEEVAPQVVRALAEKYGFDAAAEMALLNFEGQKKSVKKAAKKANKAGAEPKKAKKAEAPHRGLPWTGSASEGFCQGVKYNSGLFTQCTTAVEAGFCSGCQKEADSNASGKPNCGDVTDRCAVGILDFTDPKGRKVTGLGNWISSKQNKKNVTREDIEAMAKERDITIPEEQWEMRKVQRGRPKKDAVVSDTDDEEKPKAKRGRPRKEKKVTSLSNPGDDLIATLVQKAAAEQAAAEEEGIEMVINVVPVSPIVDGRRAACRAFVASK